jgi:preprotein translocase subunit SecG
LKLNFNLGKAKMIIFLMIIFVFLCFLLALAILMQQGKGDMGLGGLGGGSQMLFGGSGGQEFFEKITWIMGALFIAGSLGLALIKSRELESTRLTRIASPVAQAQTQQLPLPQQAPTEIPQTPEEF